ncbi:hypothetical protein LX82_03725 [Celeribacter halophilus]|uniref:Uncharacterized protein n=1 Tax=Celeribacter halophilus TaxID=576117 RepID=A0A1I3X9E8_9RHOB|nr:hypothetical protein LX82_03725 [Celeribacter halophilus]SFK16253.1 hypothetical protein SAMN04488138_1454 [Celeribacter halophilus]
MIGNGPDRPFASLPSAAVQLHQTGHSSTVQHFLWMKVGRVGQTVLSLRLRQ